MKKLSKFLILPILLLVVACSMEEEEAPYLGVDTITIGDDQPITLVVGQQQQLSVTLSPDNSLDVELNWNIDKQDPWGLVSLDSDGVITANEVGYAIISVALSLDGSIYATCEVSVVEQSASGDQTPTEMSLADFSAENYPDTDVWVVTDSQATTSQFEGLREALNVATGFFGLGGEDRDISLRFPSLEAIPAGALCSNISLDDGYGDDSLSTPEYSDIIIELVSVEAPMAQSVGDYAFSGTTGFAQIDLSSVSAIGEYAFEGCNIEELELDLLTYIGDYAFSGCSDLTTANFSRVERIGENVFLGTLNLEQLTIATESQLESIGEFGGIEENVNLTIGSTDSLDTSTNTLTIGEVSWGEFMSCTEI